MKKILGLMIIASVIAVASCSGITITTGDDDTNATKPAGIYVSAYSGVDTSAGTNANAPVQSINKGIELAVANSLAYVYVNTTGVFSNGEGLATNGNGVDVTNFSGITISGGWNDGFTAQSGFCVVNAVGLDSGLNFEKAKDILLYNFAISGGSATVGGGIEMVSCTNVTISNNYVTNNAATSFGGGVGVNHGNTNITVINLTVVGNGAADGGGLWVAYDTVVNVKNTIISNNTATTHGGAVYASGSKYLTIDNCRLFGSSTGQQNVLSLQSISGDEIINFSLLNSTIGGTSGDAIRFDTAAFTGTIISNNVFQTAGLTDLTSDTSANTTKWDFAVAEIDNLNAIDGFGDNTTN